MKIIKCTQRDLYNVSEFYDRVTKYLDEHINYPKWVCKEYPGLESTGQAIEAEIQYACIDNDKVVGAFILSDNPQGDYGAGAWREDLRRGEYLVIHTLAAEPQMYHKGLGRAMVSFCIEQAIKDGYKAIRLDVVPDNLPARKLYEKMGFLFAGEKDLARGIEEIPRFALYELNF